MTTDHHSIVIQMLVLYALTSLKYRTIDLKSGVQVYSLNPT